MRVTQRRADVAFEMACRKGYLTAWPDRFNSGCHYIFVETRDMGDETPELVDIFIDLRTGEYLRVAH